MARKITYLYNPISGTRKKTALLELITTTTAAKNIAFELMETSATGDYTLLRTRAEIGEISDVVICGGDGTVSAVAAALMGVPVRVGIIPMGSGNGLALAAKIPTVPAKALAIIFDARCAFIDGFYINNQFSCMLCGIGFDAQVATDFARQKKRGLGTYIKVSIKNFFRANTFPFTLQTRDANITTDAFFISIANSNQFGNNFTIAPQASLSDGKLDIVVVKKMNKLILPFAIFAQVSGINEKQELADYMSKKNIFYFQAEELTITNSMLAPMHIDGDEKETSTSFHIRLVKNAINLIQPQ